MDFNMSHNIYTVKGLPKQLSILLGTIIENNTVNTWNIYENVNKQTCVTIRFNESTAIDPVHYRRVSERQAKRNVERAAKHNSINKPSHISERETSDIKGDIDIVRKKRKIGDSPEISTHHSPESSRDSKGYTSKTFEIDTPISLRGSTRIDTCCDSDIAYSEPPSPSSVLMDNNVSESYIKSPVGPKIGLHLPSESPGASIPLPSFTYTQGAESQF